MRVSRSHFDVLEYGSTVGCFLHYGKMETATWDKAWQGRAAPSEVRRPGLVSWHEQQIVEIPTEPTWQEV